MLDTWYFETLKIDTLIHDFFVLNTWYFDTLIPDALMLDIFYTWYLILWYSSLFLVGLFLPATLFLVGLFFSITSSIFFTGTVPTNTLFNFLLRLFLPITTFFGGTVPTDNHIFGGTNNLFNFLVGLFLLITSSIFYWDCSYPITSSLFWWDCTYQYLLHYFVGGTVLTSNLFTIFLVGPFLPITSSLFFCRDCSYQ